MKYAQKKNYQTVSCEIKFPVHAERLLKRAFNVVRAAVFQVCDVRLQFRTFWGKKGPIFGNKD